jgi:hypothetical protein
MGSINAKMADQMTHALTIRNRLQDRHAAKIYHQSTKETRNVSRILQLKASLFQIANKMIKRVIHYAQDNGHPACYNC